MQEEFSHKEMLHFVASQSRYYRYYEHDGKWAAVDCRDGLVFITRDEINLEDAVKKTKEYHDSKTNSREAI